jgi:hypothetical protein
MEVYKSETSEILRRYRAGEITRRACINALDAAVAGLVPRLRPKDVPALRALLEANNKALVEEAKKRIRSRGTN